MTNVKDFIWKKIDPWGGNWHYVGTYEVVEIPHKLMKDGELIDVISYRYMFYGTNVNKVISTNKGVTDMSFMFCKLNSATLDLSNFYTSNVINMEGMFCGVKVKKLNLSNFDTSNVTTMWGMFLYSKTKELDLSGFDTSNVTNMGDMFSQTRIEELDLSGFDTSNVTNTKGIFYNAKGNVTLNLEQFKISNK